MKKGIAAVLAVTVATIGLAIWVGFNIHPHDSKTAFNWDLFAAVGTATGTTLLATLTGTLAVVTWSDVQASRRIAEGAGEERRARERPIMLFQDIAFTGDGHGTITAYVRVRNAGEGTAVRGSMQLGFAPDSGPVTHIVDFYLTSLMSGEEKDAPSAVRVVLDM